MSIEVYCYVCNHRLEVYTGEEGISVVPCPRCNKKPEGNTWQYGVPGQNVPIIMIDELRQFAGGYHDGTRYITVVDGKRYSIKKKVLCWKYISNNGLDGIVV